MIDLHIHSIYSDGSCTVQEILQEAQKKKLEVISITDHDKVDAYKELATLNIKKYFFTDSLEHIHIAYIFPL